MLSCPMSVLPSKAPLRIMVTNIPSLCHPDGPFAPPAATKFACASQSLKPLLERQPVSTCVCLKLKVVLAGKWTSRLTAPELAVDVLNKLGEVNVAGLVVTLAILELGTENGLLVGTLLGVEGDVPSGVGEVLTTPLETAWRRESLLASCHGF